MKMAAQKVAIFVYCCLPKFPISHHKVMRVKLLW